MMSKTDKYDEIVEKLEILEKKYQDLENELRPKNEKIKIQNQTENDTSISKRSFARNYLISQISDLYPGLFVSIASRNDGGGILLTRKKDMATYKVKFYYSRNYKDNRLFAWFSIRAKDINQYDYYALSVDFNNENHVFILDNESLKSF